MLGNGRIHSRCSSTVSLASAVSNFSSSGEESFKAKLAIESKSQISEIRTKCALVAAADEAIKIVDAEDESKLLADHLSDTLQALKLLSQLKGEKGNEVPSPEDLTELEKTVKNLEAIEKSLAVLKAPLTLSSFAPIGGSELKTVCEVFEDCDQLIAEFENHEAVPKTCEVTDQVSKLRCLSHQISQKLIKLENLNELEKTLRRYEESMLITKLFKPLRSDRNSP